MRYLSVQRSAGACQSAPGPGVSLIIIGRLYPIWLAPLLLEVTVRICETGFVA